MLSNKHLIIGALATCFLSAFTASAQTTCDGTSLNAESLITEAREQCCSRRGRRRRNACIRPLTQLGRESNEEVVGTDLAAALRAATTNFFSTQCSTTPPAIPACTTALEVTPTEFGNALESRCDSLNASNQRALVNRLSRAVRNLRTSRLEERSLTRQYRSAINDAQDDGRCNGGDPFPSFCRRFFGRDGANQFVARPSESTNSPVVLFPRGVNVSGCTFINADNGRNVRAGFSTGFANGGREHIRVAGEPDCRTLPRNLLLACRSGDCATLSAGACNRTD